MKVTVAGGGFTYQRDGKWRGAGHGQHLDLTADDRVKAALESGVLVKGHLDAAGIAKASGSSPTRTPAPASHEGQPAGVEELSAKAARVDELEEQLAGVEELSAKAARVDELEEQLASAPVLPEGWLSAAKLAELKVDEVTAYLDEHPEQREYVIALEREGDARKGITGDEG